LFSLLLPNRFRRVLVQPRHLFRDPSVHLP
jgi:hypothetical protein